MVSKTQKVKKIDERIQALSFEEALRELNEALEKLESGKMSLEDSVIAFEQGVQLSRRCESLLQDAEQRLQVLNEQGE